MPNLEVRQYNPQWADILGFEGHEFVSISIKIFTLSKISHVGMVSDVTKKSMQLAMDNEKELFIEGRKSSLVFNRELVDEWQDSHQLFESTTLAGTPCNILRRKFSGVQAHFPMERINEYNGRVWCYRLLPAVRRRFNSEQGSTNLSVNLLEDIGSIYDGRGAILSGTHVVKHWWAYSKADRSSLFCSEYLGRVIQNTGIYQFGNVSKFSPGKLLRILRASEIYDEPFLIKEYR